MSAGAAIGLLVTLGGLHAARALVERWGLGTMGTLVLGWALGMAFVVALIVLGSATRAA